MIYADLYILANMGADWLLLLGAGLLLGREPRRWRLALGALLGGAYALAALYLPLLGTVLPQAIAALGICAAAYGIRPLRGCGTLTALFFVMGCLLAGAVEFLQRTVQGRVRPSLLLAGMSLAWLLTLLLTRLHRPRGEAEATAAVECRAFGKCCTFTALRDTGNALTDPMTHRPVLIAEAAAVAALFPAAVRTDLRETDAAMLCLQLREAGIPGLRLIPCRTVSGETLLPCFTPDALTVDGKPSTAVIALTAAAISSTGAVQALV